MRKLVVVVVVVLAAVLTACRPSASDDGELAVVASFYPVAYAAQQVGGDLVSVRNLTPAGVEPHDLELTSDDVDRIDSAAAVFYVGSGFQSAVAAAARRSGHHVDVASGLVDIRTDPHFWLDPTLMAKAVDRVAAGLAKADAVHASQYRKNATTFKAQLATLDADFETTLSQCARKEIVTAHAAFHYLAERYGLTQHAVTGISPEAEADPHHLAELADLIRRDGVTTVFFEELVPRNFADTLAREAHVKTAVLSPLEGLTKKQQARGDTYLTAMRGNLATLKTALGC